MNAQINFGVDFQFYIIKANKVAYALNSLISCQCSHMTGQGTPTLTASFADPNHQIVGLSGSSAQSIAPQAMDVVQLRLLNRFGQWGVAWTGYIDAVHRISDPSQGELVQIVASNPMKLFEIGRQNPGDVAALTPAMALGITGSALLTYACQAVGFPTDSKNLIIDSGANAGAFLWGAINMANYTTPDQQTWSAVVYPLASSSGLEIFCDEWGRLFWRRPGYLSVPANPRTVAEEEILHADLAESDQGVVTGIEVRWSQTPYTQLGVFKEAPASMIQHLRTRRLVVYAPWLTNANAASFLAQSLMQMYSANVLVGSVTIPADPLYTIGSVIQVPSLLPGGGLTQYYLSAITYSLDWGGVWAMTLGLNYGRSPGQGFPYLGNLTYPVADATALQGFAQYSDQTPNLGPFSVVAAPANILPTQVILDCSTTKIAAGTIIQVRDPSTSAILGLSPNGEYVVVDGGTSYPDKTLGLSGGLGGGNGVVLIIRSGVAGDPTSSDPSTTAAGSAPSPTSPQYGPTQQTPITGTSPPDANGYQLRWPVSPPINITQPFGPTGYTSEPIINGVHFHTGIDIGVAYVPAYAAADGVVSIAGWDNTGFGNLVKINCDAGNLSLLYGHNSQILVSPGDHVAAGKQISVTGSTGNSSGPHLHFEVRLNGTPVDPLSGYLGPAPTS